MISKEVRNQRTRERRAADPSYKERHRLDAQRWREENRAHYNDYMYSYAKRWYHLKNRYGMTEEDYQRKLQTQGGVCAICGREPPLTKRGNVSSLHWDHNHSTNQHRGLLCVACNFMVGVVESDKYQPILEYLKFWEDEEEEKVENA